jgi:hypothetical protein
MIRIVQCLCPLRHAIMALAYETDSGIPAALHAAVMEAALKNVLDAGIEAHMLNPWCGLCGSREWHYEDGATRFRTLEEAEPELARLQAQNLAARGGLQSQN